MRYFKFFSKLVQIHYKKQQGFLERQSEDSHKMAPLKRTITLENFILQIQSFKASGSFTKAIQQWRGKIYQILLGIGSL